MFRKRIGKYPDFNQSRLSLTYIGSRLVVPVVAVGIFVGAGYHIVSSEAQAPEPAKVPQISQNDSPAVAPRECPPLPAFPDANCTGVPPDARLKSCIFENKANGVYDSCEFPATLWITQPNITIKNSKINGGVQSDGLAVLNLVMTDVEIDGGNSSYDGVQNAKGYSCIRCNVHGAAKGFTGSSFTIIDSYVHSLHGSRLSTSQAVLGSAGDITIRHSSLLGVWANGDTGGAANGQGGTMAGAATFYSHGSFWPPLKNVLFEQNYLQAVDGHCLYAGDDAGQTATHEVHNAVFRDNVFHISNQNPKKCGGKGSVTAYLAANGNVWHNNRYTDGSAVTP